MLKTGPADRHRQTHTCWAVAGYHALQRCCPPPRPSLVVTLFPSNSDLDSRVRSQRGWFSHSVVSDSCDPMDYNLPGSSVHEILQARVLEGVAISFSRHFPTQESKPLLLHCRQILYPPSYKGSPRSQYFPQFGIRREVRVIQ